MGKKQETKDEIIKRFVKEQQEQKEMYAKYFRRNPNAFEDMKKWKRK